MNSADIAQDEISSFVSPLGSWAFLIDDNNYAFIILTTAQYPSGAAASTLADIQQKFYDTNPDAREKQITTEEINKEFLHEFANEYALQLEYQKSPSYELQMKVKDSLKASIENTNRNALTVCNY